MAKRICKECGNPLSRYNETDKCFHHRQVDSMMEGWEEYPEIIQAKEKKRLSECRKKISTSF